MAIMTYVNNYLDQVVEPMFQRDEQGRELFFPFGMGGRGRVVPDAATGVRLRENLHRFWIVFFAVWIPIIAVASNFIPNIWVMLGVILLSVLGMWAFTASIAKELEVTARRMTPRNQIASMAETATLKRLVWMTILSSGLTAIGVVDLLVPAISQGQPGWFKPMAAFTAVFFGATTAMWALMALKKWRQA